MGAGAHDRVGAARAFVDDEERAFRPLAIAAARAAWDLATTGLAEHAARKQAVEIEIRHFFGDYGKHHRTNVFDRTLAEHPDADPALRRRIRLLKLGYLEGQADERLLAEQARLSAEVERVFVTFRPRLSGAEADDNDLRHVLATDGDALRRQAAWEASRAIGREVAPSLVQLARVRNDAARRMGFRDHRALALAVSEVDETWLDAFLDALEARTREPYRHVKEALDRELAGRHGVTPDALQPWHYPDPFFQEPPPTAALDLDALLEGRDLVAATLETFRALGLDVEDAADRSDLAPRPGKSQHAFCVSIDRERDVRVLGNVVPGAYWATTLLHEFGHAVYELSFDRELPFLLRCPAHPLTTEAVAILFGRLAYDPTWLERHAGLGRDAAERVAPALARVRHAGRLVFARWALTVVEFERALYADPEQDLASCWWALAERYQGLARPPGRDAPDWAAKVHLTTHPVYYQNYLLGEVLASQLGHTIRARTGAGLVGNAAAGRFLASEVLRPGARLPWDALVRQATGAPLTIDAYLDPAS